MNFPRRVFARILGPRGFRCVNSADVQTMRTTPRRTCGQQRLMGLIAPVALFMGCAQAKSCTGTGGDPKPRESGGEKSATQPHSSTDRSLAKGAQKEVRPPAYGNKILRRIRVGVRLEKVVLHQRDRAELHVVFSRPDDALPFPKDGRALPPTLQVWTVVPSNSENTKDLEAGGGLCDKMYPRRCTTELAESEQGAAVARRIKVLFIDGAYGSSVIMTPKLAPLAPPQVLDWNAEDAQFTIRFEDVGAGEYEVAYTGCGAYGNDGINPCSTQKLTIKRAGLDWNVTPSGDAPGTRVRIAASGEPDPPPTAKVIQIITPFRSLGAEKQSVRVTARHKTRQGRTELWRESWDDSKPQPTVDQNDQNPFDKF